MASFTVADPEVASTVRTLHRFHLVERPSGIDIQFVGKGFLRYQIRRMVGALFQVGWGQLSLTAFDELLSRPTPGAHLLTAPARGLTLEKVFYRPSPQLQPKGVADV